MLDNLLLINWRNHVVRSVPEIEPGVEGGPLEGGFAVSGLTAPDGELR